MKTWTLYFAENFNEDFDADEFLQECLQKIDEGDDGVYTMEADESDGRDEKEIVKHLLSNAFCRGWSLIYDWCAVVVERDGAGAMTIVWSGSEN